MTNRNCRLSYAFEALVEIRQPPLIAEVVLLIANAECVCFVLNEEWTSETAVCGIEGMSFASPALTFQQVRSVHSWCLYLAVDLGKKVIYLVASM
jgi:hypothetical protein